MKKRYLFFLAVALAVVASVQTYADGWLTDYDSALKKAKAENKVMMINFSGSDWCHWCIRLDEEVFSQQEFKKFAAEKLILMLIDFPMNKELDPKDKENNEKLASLFNVGGFPTVMLVTHDNEVIAQTGYRSSGAANYVKYVDTLIKNFAPSKGG